MAQQSSGGAENLQRYLLLPRPQVGLREVREVDTRVDPSGSKIRPIIITYDPNPVLRGQRSRQRSALVTVNGEAFKVEGCNVEKAFGKRKFYTTEHRATPVGGYLLSVAEKRIEVVQRINDRLKQEEWPVPYEPEAIIHYGREFAYSPYGIWWPFVKLSRGNRYTTQEELAAPVMRIKGDTSLSELYPLRPKDSGAAREIAFSIGLMAGAQDRKMGRRRTGAMTNPEHFSRYLQDFVVFLEDDRVYVARVGDETAFLYRHVKDPLAEYRGVEKLISAALKATSEDEEEDEEEDRLEEAEDVGRDALKGMLSSKHYHHKPFREQFWQGYAEGHKNPDYRRPIARADLHAAYGLA